MRGGVLDAPPNAKRSSIGIGADGSLHVDRIAYSGYWQGSGQRRAVLLNQPAATQGGTTLYTSACGPTTPVEKVSVLEVDALAVPGERAEHRPRRDRDRDLAGRRRRRSRPAARCSSPAARRRRFLGAEAPVGSQVTRPPDPDAELGRDRRRDRRRARARPQRQGGLPRERAVRDRRRSPPALPRTAVGQLADGRIVLVAVDGSRPGYSIGMTSFELALALAAPRRRPGLGARRGRLDDDGLRRHAPQPAVGHGRRALGLGCADAALHGCLRAAAAARRCSRRTATGSPTSSRSPTRSCARRP